MLPQLLNIIGGTNVRGSACSSFAKGHASSPEPATPPGGNGGGMRPDMKNAGFGLGLIAVVAVLIWLGTGFFIVNEGQQAVITQFGRYKATVGAGFNWRLPYPIQRHEIVVVTQIRSADVGRDNIVRSTGLRESAMLTEDENIVGQGRSRLWLTPGVTGLWQVLGRSDIPFAEMITLDYLYVTNWSLWGDLKLLARTLPAVMRGRGAY